MLKILLTTTLLLYAQDPRSVEMNSLQQTGKLFTVKLTPKEKVLQFEFVGHKTAELNFDDKTFTLYMINGSKRELVRLKQRNSTTFETEPLEQSKNLQLELKTSIKDSPENFRFKLP